MDDGPEIKIIRVPEDFLHSIAQPGDQESCFETLAYTSPEDRSDRTIIDHDDFVEAMNDPMIREQNLRILEWMKRGMPSDEDPFQSTD